ncbi:MAG: ribonuclease HII [Candidatus Obscuribacterales bacterium]|nr:ribonuclease HII [Candidatus Obscuribacterales bacterium]
MSKELATTGDTVDKSADRINNELEKKKEPAKKKSAADKTQSLFAFDREIAGKNLRKPGAVLLGTDEVGRGCLAGPVVAAAVQLPDLSVESDLANLLRGLNDSKKLSPQKRQELAALIKTNCRYAIAESSVEEIDKINILQASFLAMRRAISQLELPDASVILVDGNQKISKLELRQIMVIGGDGISASIAAASVIAKVYRDELMSSLSSTFPQYRWDSNKGYGSKDHRDAILEHGLSIWHRQSFCRKIENTQLNIVL